MSVERNTWMAIATKIGGQLVLIGGEYTEGTLVSLSNTHWRFDFNINSFRAGPGIGISGGYVIVFAFNCVSPHQLDGTAIEDWGLNISLAAKWKAVAQTLGSLKLYTTIGRVGIHMAVGLHDADVLRNAAHTVSTAFDIANRGAQPTIIALDTPLGAGAEISLVKIYGTIHIGENQSVITPMKR